MNTNFIKIFPKRREISDKEDEEESRPCKLVEEKKNVWRVVYADEFEDNHN